MPRSPESMYKDLFTVCSRIQERAEVLARGALSPDRMARLLREQAEDAIRAAELFKKLDAWFGDVRTDSVLTRYQAAGRM